MTDTSKLENDPQSVGIPAQAKKKAASPLEGMPEPKTKPAKTERLFIAYAAAGAGQGTAIRDLRVYGVKAECLEFAIDQEPAWKWVEVAKGESVSGAILDKAAK